LGEVKLSGPASELSSNPALMESYLGTAPVWPSDTASRISPTPYARWAR